MANKKMGKIKITQMQAVGKAFANLTPGSEHAVVNPPKGQKNGERGLWVMGVGEPVLVLFHEFNRVKS